MRQRCPFCYWEFTIPTAEQVADVARRSRSEYALSPAGNRALAESNAFQTYLAVICRVCGTRMYATPQEVGEEMECPDCGTRTKVSPPLPPPAASPPLPASSPEDEEYSIYQGEGQPPPNHREVHQTYIPVVCGVCRTRMLATLDQVGQEIICPDCDTPAVVPPPATPTPRVSVGPSDYGAPYAIGLWNWWETAAAPPDTASAEMQLLEEPAEEYAVSAPQPTLDLKPALFPESESAAVETPGEDEPRTLRSIEEEEPEEVPRRPFLTGVFSFPFYSGSLIYWIVLWIGAAGIAVCVREAYLLTQSSELGWALSILLIVLSGLFGLLWMMFASAVGMAIVQDTSDGCDRIVNWPQGTVFEWFPEFLVVVNSLSLSLIAGLGLGTIFGVDAPQAGFPPAIAGFVLFPLFLVSMLEGNSPWKPFSWPIWRSVFSVGWAWGLFYLETGLIGLVVVVPAARLAAMHPLIALPAVAALVTALMIYFRLLGRLVWYCAQQLPDEEEEEEEEEAEN